MKADNESVLAFTSSNHGVISVPMTLVILTIISTIIISLFAVSAGIMQSTYDKEMMKNSLNSIIDQVYTMTSYSTEENRISTKITIPESVDVVIFGSNTIDSSSLTNNTIQYSYDSQCMIICKFTDGDFFLLHSPIGFCDGNKKPLSCGPGRYTLVFQLDRQDQEVVAVGSIH